jgi:predicted Zn-dependent peptidase
MDHIRLHTLSNGLILAVERIEGVASAAIDWRLPAGSATDAPDRQGVTALLKEFLPRGAGGMTARQHSDALDRAGAQRGSDLSAHHLGLSAAMLGDHVDIVLGLLAPVAASLALDEDGLEPSKSLCLQSIESLKDDPANLAMIRLRERHLPPPFNRSGLGEKDAIERATIDDVRAAWRGRARPGGSIIGLAGAVNAERAIERLETLLSKWSGAAPEAKEIAPPARGSMHVNEPSAQVHIAVACDAPREADADSTLERLATAVLSGGMSGRLFTEVREKRSLCYAVSATYSPGRDRGILSMYSGTTPERAQETLDVCLAEVRRMTKGVTAAEFARASIGLRSRLVMQGESTAARAAAIARDVFTRGRPRTLGEIAREIEAVSLDQLNAYLARRTYGPFTVVSVGPTELRAA